MMVFRNILIKLLGLLRSLRARRIILGLMIFLMIGTSLLWYNNASKPITLYIAIQAIESASWRELIKDFEKEIEKKVERKEERKKIYIELIETSDASDAVEEMYEKVFSNQKKSRNNLFQNIVGIFQGEELNYDLVYVDTVWLPKFAHNEWLVDLNNVIEKDKIKKISADFLEKDWRVGLYKKENQKEEGLYRIPFHSDVSLLYYNKTLLTNLFKGYDDKHKLPNNFNDLKNNFKSLKNNSNQDIWNYIWQGQQYEGLVTTFVEVLKSYGGEWINDKKRTVQLSEDGAIEAAKFLHDTINEKISPPEVTTYTERETATKFQNGEAVFMRNWPFAWAEANAEGSKIRDEFDIVQRVSDTKMPACLGGWGLGISEFTKHRDAAWKAIQFFSSAATQRKYALKTGNMPSRLSLLNDPQLVKRYSYYPTLLKVSQNAVLRPSIPEYMEASKILQKHLTCVLRIKNIKEEEIIEKIGSEMKLATIDTEALLKSRHTEEPFKGGNSDKKEYECLHGTS